MCIYSAKINASSWRKAVDLIAKGTQANQQVQTTATVDSSKLENFPLSTLSADDSSPPQVNYGNNMRKSMEDRQINDFYEAQRHIQSTMMGDTQVKTVQNRQCIDNVSDYDSEHYRITKSVHHRLDLGPISLPGAQQHTTVESAAALKRQDKIEGKFKAHIQSENGQYRNKMYKRAENMIPQLDGTFNVSDSSNTDSHDYLDIASSNIIQYRTRGQKQRHEENEMVYVNRCSAHIEYIKPKTKVKTQRQKVPDDEDIDMAKIVKDDKPRHDRQKALETKRQLQEKEAKRLVLAKAKQLQIEKDTFYSTVQPHGRKRTAKTAKD